MTYQRPVHTLTYVVSIFSLLISNAQAENHRKGKDGQVVVGILKRVDATGTKFEILQSDGQRRALQTNAKSVVRFVGLTADVAREPEIGMEVKATCEKDDIIKSITFTPPVGEPAILGDKRLKMTEMELFEEVDKDANNSISYVEFSKYIHHSPKHGPDAFRKADQTGSGGLNSSEFAEALKKVAWWKLSRQTPAKWFAQADKNGNKQLDAKEFVWICTSGNHLENIFKRTDRDASGSLSEQEVTTYILGITLGKKKTREKRKKADR
ncbi:MAG: hypothetical protein VXX31_01255 [Planctomycetota bacterium]|nr:hypothetical protein [Planctomycetota bacterium]